MDPTTGAPDNADRLRVMRYWLSGTPNGVYPFVQGEVPLQQSITDQARLAALKAIVDATYPTGAPSFNQPEPTLPFWRVTGQLAPGPLLRGAGKDTIAHVRVLLSISSSPLALTFTVDPTITEAAFRALVQSQFAVIAAAAS